MIRQWLQFILELELLWGFLVGLLLATALHTVLLSKSPRWLLLITTSSPGKSFAQLHNANKDGMYSVSFFRFQKLVHHIKFMAGLVLLLIFTVITLALFQVMF